MLNFPEAQKFLLASYHDLPNILFVGSLILGSLLGYLPLVWVALGMLLNGAITASVQYFLQFLLSFESIAKWDEKKRQLRVPASEYQRCYVGFKPDADNYQNNKSFGSATKPIVAPSYWMSSSAFFSAFTIYNSIWVTARQPNKNTDSLMVATRRAFSLSTLIIGVFFLGLVFSRAFLGCETLTGGTLGVLLGAAVAVGFWHTLDACGTGKIPDILQVVGSMAPDRSKTEQPVMCTPPTE